MKMRRISHGEPRQKQRDRRRARLEVSMYNVQYICNLISEFTCGVLASVLGD